MIIITHDSHYKRVSILSQPTTENYSRFIQETVKTRIINEKFAFSVILKLKSLHFLHK